MPIYYSDPYDAALKESRALIEAWRKLLEETAEMAEGYKPAKRRT